MTREEMCEQLRALNPTVETFEQGGAIACSAIVWIHDGERYAVELPQSMGAWDARRVAERTLQAFAEARALLLGQVNLGPELE